MVTANTHPVRESTLGEVIRVVVVDVDGCLSGGEAQPIDLDLLRCIGDLNERSRNDPLVPAITFLTGRSAQYLELLIQLTRGYLPAIYECGAAALLPSEYRFVYNPFLDSQAFDHIRRARDLLWAKLGETHQACFQPGLELIISAYPLEPVTMSELNQQIQALLEPYQYELVVEQARTCVDIVLKGVGKGNGLQWLSQLANVPVSAMAGIGDSLNDLPFLELVAFSAAPDNAHPEVKQAVDYASSFPNGEGVRDFLERCLHYNREGPASQAKAVVND